MKMSKAVPAAGLVLLAMLGNAASGFATEAQAARISLNATSREICKAGSCNGASKATLSITHAFEADKSTIDHLQGESSIKVLIEGWEIPFQLKEDPKYVNGASSARVTKSLPIDYLKNGTLQVTAQMSWSGTQFQVTLKGKASGEPNTQKAVKSQKILATELVTRIETPNVALFQQNDDVPVDYTSTGNSSYDVNGDSRYQETTVLKTVAPVK
jgi:hypothetical protein